MKFSKKYLLPMGIAFLVAAFLLINLAMERPAEKSSDTPAAVQAK